MVVDLAKKYTGAVAESYERDRCKQFSYLYEDVVFTSTLRTLSDLYGRVKTALDIPCGTGRFHRYYEDFGIDCIGVDLSADMLAIADKKGMKIQERDFFTFTMNEPVDLVVCVRFLNYFDFETQSQAFKILSGLTKRLLFFQIETHEKVESLGQSKSKWFPTIAQVREHVENNGMEIRHWHAAEIKKEFSTNIILAQNKNNKGD